MFNPANLAKEIFGILRSFDYTVNIFDYDGNRVYEPEEARRFFASPKNMTVSILEDGENSNIKLFLSKSTNINEVKGLIDTMRTMASKFNVLFNVRKYDREITPKDLAPNGPADLGMGVVTAPAEEESEPEPENVDLNSHVDKISAEMKKLKNELESITSKFAKINKDKPVKESVGETMNTENLIEKREEEMTDLPALGCRVETAAWEAFKNHGTLEFYSPPEEFDDNLATATVLRLHAIAAKTKADGMANMFSRVANAIEAGTDSKLIQAIAKRAITAAYSGTQTVDEGRSRKEEMIYLPALDCDVEKSGWEDFKEGKLALRSPVDLGALQVVRGGVNRYATYLRAISENVALDGMANMFSRVATNFEMEKASPLMVAVAKQAIAAVGGENKISEQLIVTESISAFANWFDSHSTASLFESEFIDPQEAAIEAAYKRVKDEFDVDAFLAVYGNYFNWGDDSLTPEDKMFDASEIISALKSYLRDELESAAGEEINVTDDDVNRLADLLFPSVKTYFEDNDYTIDDAVAEGLEPITSSGSIGAGDMAATKNLDGVEDLQDIDLDPTADADGQSVDDKEIEEGEELAREDVLLPKREDDDFSREIIADHDDNDLERMRTLAGLNPSSVATTPRLPRP